MNLEGIEKVIVETIAVIMAAGAAIIGALVSVVRSGDLTRLEAIEQAQRDLTESHKDLAAAGEAGRERIYDEIHSLRGKVDSNHSQLVALIVERRP